MSIAGELRNHDTNKGHPFAGSHVLTPGKEQWEFRDMVAAVHQPFLGERFARHKLHLGPLVGGIDPDLAWESLMLLGDRVVPRLELEPIA